MVHYAEGHAPQLFDLTHDPAEEQDVASQRPDMLAEGQRRMHAVLDPEEVNDRAHQDQKHRVEELGGRKALLEKPQWNFTPADSR